MALVCGGASRTSVAEGGGALWRARPKAARPQGAHRYRKVLRGCSKSKRCNLCGRDPRRCSSLVLLSLPRWTSSQPRAQKILAGALQASARNDHSSAGRPNRRPTSNAASLGGARWKRLPRLSRAGYARPAWTGARRSCTPPTVWCDPCLLVPAAAGL